MTPITWETGKLQEICERVASLEEFFKRNHMTLVYDTSPEDPERARLLKNVRGLHKILQRMLSVEEQNKQG